MGQRRQGDDDIVVNDIDIKELSASYYQHRFDVDGVGMRYEDAVKLRDWLNMALKKYADMYLRCYVCRKKIEQKRLSQKRSMGIVGSTACSWDCRKQMTDSEAIAEVNCL